MSKKIFNSEEVFTEKLLKKISKSVKEFNKSKGAAKIFFNYNSMKVFCETDEQFDLGRFREFDDDCVLVYKSKENQKTTSSDDIINAIKNFEL